MDQSRPTFPNHQNVQYLIDALNIIDRNCKGFRDGHYPDYRVIADQLRMLLCDKNRQGESK